MSTKSSYKKLYKIKNKIKKLQNKIYVLEEKLHFEILKINEED
jgi:hypothetical protein